MRSIAAKLVLGFATVALVGVLIVAFLMSQYTTGEFGSYVARGINARDQRAADYLAERYGTAGWQGVRASLPALSHWTGMRLVVVDPAGKVVADSEGRFAPGEAVSPFPEVPVPILAAGETTADLYVISPTSAPSGASRMMDHMMPMVGGSSMMEMMLPASGGSSESHFLGVLDRAAWTAGGIALAVALLVGLALSYRITSPLRRLMVAAGQVAAGDFSQRVPAGSGDELASLGNAFNSMAESLARNEQQRKQLLSDIAHELNTPITVLQGNLEAMIDGLAEPSTERLSSLQEETLLLSRLVADLRDLSLAESGRLRLRIESVDIGDLLKGVLSATQAEAEGRGIELSVEVEPSLPTLQADRDRVGQVLRNLLANALHYTGSGGVVKVKAAAVNSRGGQDKGAVLVSVVDTGIGISPEDLPSVFDRFFRADRSRNRASGGTGLGLSVVKQLVEAHGGTVWAESEAGRGSVFHFTLPATPFSARMNSDHASSKRVR